MSYRRAAHWDMLLEHQRERIATLEKLLEVIRADVHQRGGTASPGQVRRLERLDLELDDKREFLTMLTAHEALTRDFERTSGPPPLAEASRPTEGARPSGASSMVEVW